MNDTSNKTSNKSAILRMLIPLALLSAAIGYCWWKLLSTQYAPQWQHYFALVAYIIVLVVFIKDRARGTAALGIYLILAITTVCSLTYEVSYAGFQIGSLPIPIGNLLAWGFFIVYLSLNMVALFDYYLDYKERKGTL